MKSIAPLMTFSANWKESIRGYAYCFSNGDKITIAQGALESEAQYHLTVNDCRVPIDSDDFQQELGALWNKAQETIDANDSQAFEDRRIRSKTRLAAGLGLGPPF